MLCFDSIEEAWMDLGISDFPGQADGYFIVVALNNSTIAVMGDSIYTEERESIPSPQVFSLDINSGNWTRLDDLPTTVSNKVEYLRVISENKTSVIVVRG